MSSTRFHRLQQLFDAASDLPVSEQMDFLQEACGDDEELQRELRSLLVLHRGDPVLSTGTFGWPKELAEGDQVGPYRLLEVIGRGGMGIVYLAEDTRLHRRVALKALSPSLRASAKQQARFRREAGMAASISHPGVATIYAFEEWDSGQYIAAEYIPGTTLADEFEGGPLTPEAVLDIGIQVSDAVAAAHEKGVVHRDLKPHNIIRGADGRLKVLDFGLAIAFEPEAGDHTRLTETGALLGTPAYMAPEQLCGEPADFRSDLFALGAVLCEAATGQRPFPGDTLAVTIAAILTGEPRGLESLRGNSPGLEGIIRRCLDKDPQQRFPSAAALHEELLKLREEGLQAPLAARRSRPGQSVDLRWWIFHQAAVVVSCCVLTAALWQVSVWVPDLATRLAFIGGLAAASVIVTLRIHLVVTVRRNRAAVARELAKALPWLRRADWSFSLMLVAAAVDVVGEMRLVAALLLGIAAAYATVFFFVEPATRDAVFKHESPGA